MNWPLAAELLLQRGALVTAIDVSDRMLELAQKRLGPEADLRRVDMSQPLDMFANEAFDFINAPLCLDYIEDWRSLFSEFLRILRPGGRFQFSCGHPAFDAEYFSTHNTKKRKLRKLFFIVLKHSAQSVYSRQLMETVSILTHSAHPL